MERLWAEGNARWPWFSRSDFLLRFLREKAEKKKKADSGNFGRQPEIYLAKRTELSAHFISNVWLDGWINNKRQDYEPPTKTSQTLGPMETHTHLAPESILKQGTETTIAYLKALQKQLDFAKHEFEEQYAINQELIQEKIWLMAYLYTFVTHFQMKGQHLESYLESQREFIHTQHAFIQEDFTHEHKDLHNLQRFCAALPIVQPKTQ